MRTIRIKLYKFNELNQDSQQKAIDNFRNNGGDTEMEWEFIQDDAKQIGLKLIELSDHRKNEGEFMLAANEVAANIFRDHGESCETYKTAQSFMAEWQPIFNNYMDENHEDYESSESENQLMDIENDFLNSLLEDYRIMYNNDIDYHNSDEYIKDTIEANEYEFTKDGKMS